MSRRGENETPILQLYRQNYVKVSGKILDTTETRLKEYIQYATDKMATDISIDDVFEHALQMFFDRDAGFRAWLKHARE